MNNNTQIEKYTHEGYGINIGTVIDLSFELWKKVAVFSAMLSLLMVIVIMLLYTALFTLLAGGFDNLVLIIQENPLELATMLSTKKGMLAIVLLSLVSSLILLPFSGSYLIILKKADEDERYGMADLFSGFSQPFFLQIFLSFLMTSFSMTLLTLLLQILHAPSFIGSFLSAIVSIGTYFMLPFIMFNDMSAIDAVKNSFILTLKKPFHILVILLLSVLLGVMGVLGLGIGIFFTYSFTLIFRYATHKHIFGQHHALQNEIDEIGADIFR